VKVVEQALAGDRMLALVDAEAPEDEKPTPEDLYVARHGGRILKMLKYPDQQRAHPGAGAAPHRHRAVHADRAVLHGRVRSSATSGVVAGSRGDAGAHGEPVRQVRLDDPYLPDELQVVAMNIKDAGKVTDLIASNLNISLDEKQDLLIHARRAQAPRELSTHPQSRDRAARARAQDPVAGADELTKNQKEFYLRQQMRAIQKELGEGDRGKPRSTSCAASWKTRILPKPRARRRITSSSGCA
jgi:ATP-dependent Lon protease